MNKIYWDLAKKAGFVFWDDDKGDGGVRSCRSRTGGVCEGV